MSQALRGKTTPEDILQDVLLEAWNRRETLEWRGLQAFRSWLLTLVDHRIGDAADFFAAQKRGGPGIGGSDNADSVPEGDPIVSTTPSRLAMFREQAEAMTGALADVPPDCRDVVRMRLFEEISSGQIAGRLGIGESAVRHRFRRGLQVYQAALEKLLSSRTRRTLELARKPDADSASDSG
jgi:RNA polymerase sigma factor (sigma-70 family)